MHRIFQYIIHHDVIILMGHSQFAGNLGETFLDDFLRIGSAIMETAGENFKGRRDDIDENAFGIALFHLHGSLDIDFKKYRFPLINQIQGIFFGVP